LTGKQLGIVLEEGVEGSAATTRRPLGGLEAEWEAGRDFALMRLMRRLVTEKETGDPVPVPGPSALALVRSSHLLLLYGMRLDEWGIVHSRVWYKGATGW
jgi:hypothetical protein